MVYKRFSLDMSNYSTAHLNATDYSSIPVVPVVVVLCFVSVCSIIGNSLVCVAIYQQPRLRTVMYLPMLSLAIADLLCGAVAMPAYITKKLFDGEEGEGIVCDIFRFTYFFTEYASISSLVIISVERMFTLKCPLKTNNPKFSRKIIALLVLAWFDALVVSLLPFIPWKQDTQGPCSYNPTKWWSLMVIHKNVFIPLLVVLSCYSYIYKIAVGHMSAICRETNHQGSYKANLTQWRQRRKATMTLSIVVGVFLLCWLPSSIYYYIHNVCIRCFDSFVGESESIFNAVVKILTFANSMTNPLIYWWRSSEFRKAFRKVIFGRFARSCAIGPTRAFSRVSHSQRETKFSRNEMVSFKKSELQ